MTTSAEISEGVDLKSLRLGSLIDVETKSHHYRIESLGGNTMRISGHPQFCPVPILAELQCSVNLEGMLEAGFIRTGMQLVLLFGEHIPMTTSRVLSVHVDQPNSSCVQ